MIHHVYACQSNVGDWLSAKAIQALLQPMPVVEHLCDDPFVPGTLARLSELSEHDLIVVGGGGLFMEYFAPFWKNLLPIAERVPIVLWGIGYCDLKDEDTRARPELLRPIVAAARLVQFRDPLTSHAFADLSIEPATPCPAVALLSPKAKEPFVLHAVNYAAFGGEAYDRVHDLTAQFAASTGRRYREINNQIDDADQSAFNDVISAYGSADVVVASRLHGCIIGLSTGAKVIAVSGDWKVESFMEQAGLGDWVGGPDDLDRLPGLLARVEEQPAAEEFIARAQLANRRFAQQVKALAAQASLPEAMTS